MWKFPNCVRCIDGKHLETQLIREQCSEFSIVLQGVADLNYTFIAIVDGTYDKESDGGVFTHSSSSRKPEQGSLAVRYISRLPESDIQLRYVILGDHAYDLHLMRPCRKVVECTFEVIASK